MIINRRLGALVLVPTLALFGLHAARAAADSTQACPAGVNTCVIVNSNLDNNVRDGVITLREALLITNGDLPVPALTPLEQHQIITMPPGWGPGETGIGAYMPPGLGGSSGESIHFGVYFDPTVFCADCASNVITLGPPGLGGSSGEAVLPNGLRPGLPAVAAGQLDSSLRIGAALTPDGHEAPAQVILDGRNLPDNYVGLADAMPNSWLRGIQFTRFRGVAVAVKQAALVGSNQDGANDAAENVTYAGNGVDVLRLGD
jgi:hypothetical protein